MCLVHGTSAIQPLVSVNIDLKMLNRGPRAGHRYTGFCRNSPDTVSIAFDVSAIPHVVFDNTTSTGAADSILHLFVNMAEGGSLYLCAVPAGHVHASVEVRCVQQLTETLCPECRRNYEGGFASGSAIHR
jgi:hypothetical protein